MKITADTNFLISATQWDNSVSHKILIKLIKADAKIFITKEILEEFSEVLQRDFKFNEKEINKIIEKVLGFAVIFETKSKFDVVKEDPDDNKVLECAFDSGSEYIISYDTHLLKIKEFRNIKIIKPEELFQILS